MPGTRPESRYRRRVLGVGGLAAFVVYVVGAPIFNNRIENDLERRVPAALAAAGHDAVTAKFSGQEGTLTCAEVLDDPEGALAVAHAVHGVDSIQLDRACRVNTLPSRSTDGPPSSSAGSAATTPGGTSAADGTPSTGVVEVATVAAVLEQAGEFSALAQLADATAFGADLSDTAELFTVFAPTDPAFDALPAAIADQLGADAELSDRVVRGHVIEGALTADALAALDGTTLTTLDDTELAVAVDGDVVTVGGARVTGGPVDASNGVVFALDEVLLPDGVAGATADVAATLAGGTLALTGTVADRLAHDTLLLAATTAVGAQRVDNAVTIDAASEIDADIAAQLATLIGTLDIELVSGTAGYADGTLYLTGAYVDDAAAERANAAAAALGATTDLARRPAASAEQAATLETELNEYVRANPILFQPDSAVLEPSAEPIIDRIAAALVELDGLTVIVAGHTDSDGTPATNQTLSERRAAAVRQALIELGVDAATITSEGFGSQQPVLENGLENKTASRRVEFQLSVG